MLESSAASLCFYSELPLDRFQYMIDCGLISLARQILEWNERIPWDREKTAESLVLKSWWDAEAVNLHLETRQWSTLIGGLQLLLIESEESSFWERHPETMSLLQLSSGSYHSLRPVPWVVQHGASC